MKASSIIRRRFFRELWRGVGIIWPVISALLVLMALIGLLVARVEGWPVSDGLYFAYVTGLTVGYGDPVPKAGTARALAMFLGLCGIVLTGLVVAIAVEALRSALHSEAEG